MEIRSKAANDAVVTDYAYDALNRLTHLVNFIDADDDGDFDEGADPLRGRYEYILQTDGQRTRLVETDGEGNDITTDWVYDELGRLTEERFNVGGTFLDYIDRYSFDLVGNRKQLAKDRENVNPDYFGANETTTYEYDANDRLVSEIFNHATNNLLDRSTFYTCSGTQQTEQKVYTGIHSSPPGPTTYKTTTSTYDVRGRLKSVSVAGGGTTTLTSYKYNHEGVRVEQSVSTNGGAATTTVYHIDPLNQTGYSQVLEKG